MKIINVIINFILSNFFLFILSICVFEIVTLAIIKPDSLNITNSIILSIIWFIILIYTLIKRYRKI
jgi:hypothetical protein